MKTRIPTIELQDKYLHNLYTRSDVFEHFSILSLISSKVNSVTEFGVREIVSTWAFLYGCPLKMVSVDLVNPTSLGKNLQEVYEIAKNNNIDYKFIQGNTLEIKIEETDFLYIDSYHEYNHAKEELNKHASKVKKYIALHDTVTFGEYGQDNTNSLNKNFHGLNKAIEEFLQENPQWIKKFSYHFSNGLVILERLDNESL